MRASAVTLRFRRHVSQSMPVTRCRFFLTVFHRHRRLAIVLCEPRPPAAGCWPTLPLLAPVGAVFTTRLSPLSRRPRYRPPWPPAHPLWSTQGPCSAFRRPLNVWRRAEHDQKRKLSISLPTDGQDRLGLTMHARSACTLVRAYMRATRRQQGPKHQKEWPHFRYPHSAHTVPLVRVEDTARKIPPPDGRAEAQEVL